MVRQPRGDQHQQAGQGEDHQRPDRDDPDGTEVDALPRGEVGTGEHVRHTVLAPGAQAVQRLLFGGPGRHLAADDPREHQVGGLTEDLRADHRAADTADDGRDHAPDLGPVVRELPQQPLARALEVHGPLGRPHHHPTSVPAHAASASVSWESTISR